jgi:hypothetical protein
MSTAWLLSPVPGFSLRRGEVDGRTAGRSERGSLVRSAPIDVMAQQDFEEALGRPRAGPR